jgi:LysM repeat protein
LATITLLAVVGVFLYVRITQTEPVMPAGLDEMEADWSQPPSIDADRDFADAGFDGGPPGDNAPSFAAVAAAPASPADTAPAWSPPTSDGESLAPAFDPGSSPPDRLDADQSTQARSAIEVPELPELPPLSGASGIPERSPGIPPAIVPSASGAVATPAVGGAPPTAATARASAANTSAEVAGVDPLTPGDTVLPTPPTAGGTGVAASGEPAVSEGGSSSLFSTAWLEVQAALDRGQLSQALLRLSDWYGDPSLSAQQRADVQTLLGQLAGSVIYEGPPAHRLEPPYLVTAGETLVDIAERFSVPWQLLAKINGISNPSEIRAGQELKVVRGPFSAIVDLSDRQLTLMLDRRYAGRFDLEVSPQTSLEEGQWKVDQKLVTPSGPGVYPSSASSEDRSLVLANSTAPTTEVAVLRGPGNTDPAAIQPRGRMLRLRANEIEDVFDILSVGSRVIIRR